MAERRLPRALDLLFTDEPLLDLYAQGPWRVPDGLIDEIAARIDALVADHRSARLTLDRHPVLRTPTPAVVADALSITAFLCGDAGVRSGSMRRLEYHLVERFMSGRSTNNGRSWYAGAGSWRPPGGALFETAGDNPDLRETAIALTAELLQALKGLDPLDRRREALLELYDRVRADDDLMRATVLTPHGPSWSRVEERWADAATDSIVATIPELTGPVGYLSWIVDGWSAAHERLSAVVPGADTGPAVLAGLLLQAGLKEAPAELAVGVRGDLYDELSELVSAMPSAPGAAMSAQRRTRAWLARAVVSGHVEMCRAWLDLAVRFTGAVQGLPGLPVVPEPCGVPVGQFSDDVRRLFRVRTVRHPLSTTSAPPVFTKPAVEERYVEPVNVGFEHVEIIEARAEPSSTSPVEVLQESEPMQDFIPEVVPTSPAAAKAAAGSVAAKAPAAPAAKAAPIAKAPAAVNTSSVKSSSANASAANSVGATNSMAANASAAQAPAQVARNGSSHPAVIPTSMLPPSTQAALVGPDAYPDAYSDAYPDAYPEMAEVIELDPLSNANTLIDGIVGQPALVAALREVAASPEHAIRLLVAGPPGTGRDLTVETLAFLLAVRSNSGDPMWITHEEFHGLGVTKALAHLHDRLAHRDGLVAIDGLDLMVSDEVYGRAIADELHRLISALGPDLQMVAFTALDGYRRLVDANAALAAWWRVVRTRDFDAGDFATIFTRVVERRGASVTADAARSAGELLASTPGEGQLRNARLATYLADLAVDAAGRRSSGLSRPTVDVHDLPPLRAEAMH